jgi:hypothetical protein
MHGLNQIHSQNTQAVYDDFNKRVKTAKALDHSYLVRQSQFDLPEFVASYPTAAQLRDYISRNIGSNTRDYTARWGSK